MEPHLLTRETQLLPGATDPGHAHTSAPPATALIGAVALVVGGLLGLAAAVADGAPGPLGLALSLPGPWIAAAVLAAITACRAGGDSARAALLGAVGATGLLVGAMAAYYAGKQLLMGAVPGPLVIFWLLLAATVGLIGGAATGRIAATPWGVPALAAGVAGWLFVEWSAVPSAPWTEAVVAVLIGASVAASHRGRRRSIAPWLTGAVIGGAGAIVAVGVLPDVLTRVL